MDTKDLHTKRMQTCLGSSFWAVENLFSPQYSCRIFSEDKTEEGRSLIRHSPSILSPFTFCTAVLIDQQVFFFLHSQDNIRCCLNPVQSIANGPSMSHQGQAPRLFWSAGEEEESPLKSSEQQISENKHSWNVIVQDRIAETEENKQYK